MEEGVIYGSTPSPQVPQQNNQAAKSSIVSYAQSQTPPPKPKPKTSKLKKILLIFLSLFLLITVVFSLIYFISLRSGEEATEKVELVWWGMWEDEAIPQSIITDFETKNPNVKVKYEYQEPAEFKEKLIARTDAGRGPDIFRFHTNWYEDLSGILLPLTSDVITKEEFEKNYYKTAQRDLIKNGAIVGIPLEVDTLALFVNPAIIEQIKTEKELLEIKLPTNWQEFIETTETLTTYDELGKIIIGGAGMGSYDNVNYAPDIISLLFAQNRVDFDNFT
ncbi:MAG: hypothetical protein A3A51_01575 [Candidatus Levybacteria bacterium RIFCSPLOWO2_01_FULL_39_10]|nr:MAG: hypothetical protein A3A51_01575 [Candidatus Levybacteria bacterium RIFCSPLOWO2_01_FULL_39_10]